MTDKLKRELLAALLEHDSSVLIHVDGRACTGLPDPFCTRATTLRIGWMLEPAIALALDARLMRCRLVFDGRSASLEIPWRAVYRARGEYTMVDIAWPMPLNTQPDIAPKPRHGLRLVG